MIELQRLLRAAQRQLWLTRSAKTVDRGLVIGNAVALLGLLWKLLVSSIPPATLAAAAAAPCLAALYWAARTRPTLHSAARWVDERCRGQGMFGTGLEFLLESRGRGSASALAALRARISRALPAAAAGVAAERMPGKLRLALLTGTCVALCGLGIRIPAARAGLRPAATQAEVRAPLDIAAAPSADLGSAAERLRTALKASVTATTAGARRATDEDEPGVLPRAALRAPRGGSASANSRDAARGDATGDGGGREPGSGAAPGIPGPAAGAAAHFRAAFRDLTTARNAEGTPRAGHESLELVGRARLDEAADFDARQRAEASYALRADTHSAAPQVESAAARALQARYAALTPLRQ